jgi:hypothetical protein
VRELLVYLNEAIATIDRLKAPVIAAVQGSLAGAGFALACCYENVPPHLQPGKDGRIAWHFRFRAGTLEIARHEADDVNVKVVVDYATVLPLAKVHYRNDPDASKLIQQLSEKAIAAGKMKLKGSIAMGPKCLARLHDALAERTL